MSNKTQQRQNWRIRVLERLNETRDIFSTNLPTEELEKLYKEADKYNESKQIEIFQHMNDNVVLEGKELPESSNQPKPTVLFKFENSFLQYIETSTIPYHLQVVVPAATATSYLNNAQTLELNTWFRSLTLIALQQDFGLVFFEYSTGSFPLIVDIFPIPSNVNDGTLKAQWKAAFEDDGSDFDNNGFRILKTHIHKGEFPQKCPYIAVTFDNSIGFGKYFQGGFDPTTLAIEVIQAIWLDSKIDPDEHLIDAIREYKQWPK
ncbi:hypothetical protein TVAG_071150 [Trichomonas vaginalis G3]|uniref:Uncharacterized protein n=1 Tax=Trichomonas vaginalis (strain ATCC PRA-98 / G3) TaxID=412133 RepID=A2D818_TRIV3|nr:hypothetical protein TVAGG3_1045800 [Trichomonas vaginalis G3]EAY23451.1 hypothetical protein TVAG_071150 [Trichomonas vaginalis G3]KAI5493864.1 hypothetical protein TVAGG3_1045800 [Trichomonas vaginalis G3]|eukprot:XP_001584437.1 hypothetical protein [Trichomonas vaginalis G3]